MLVKRMFVTLVPLIGKSPISWHVPSKKSSLVTSFAHFFGTYFALDPRARMIPRIKDPMPRRMH